MPDTTAPVSDRVIGIARDYAELAAAIRQRCNDLNVGYETLDYVAGLPLRYCAKLFSPLPVKHIGATSLGPLLGALGLKLVVEIDQEQFERVKNRLTPRKSSRATRQTHRGHPNARAPLVGNTEWAKIMNARRTVLLTPKTRSRLARRAARIRWKRARQAAST